MNKGGGPAVQGVYRWFSRPGDNGCELWGYARQGSDEERELLDAGFVPTVRHYTTFNVDH